MQISKVIILPGCGCTPVKKCNWYYSVQKALLKANVNAVLKDMPDPYDARESIWLPFIENELKCDENTILVGHSSGAEAAMRYIENHKVAGVYLVSPCVTDLDDEHERLSGYYNRPWNWEQMKQNAHFHIQYSSRDDHLIPWHEMESVHKELDTELREFHEEGHFMFDHFPELVQDILKKIKEISQGSS
jgi:predicted alpha/beta hydrolase family esterase